MDMKEKLVELLSKVQETGVNEIPAGFGCTREYVTNEKVASHLITNGVTVQEWISVKDRLPEPKELVLCIWKDINGIHYGFAGYQHDNVWYVSNEGMPEVTNWMALPKKTQPPKPE